MLRFRHNLLPRAAAALHIGLTLLILGLIGLDAWLVVRRTDDGHRGEAVATSEALASSYAEMVRRSLVGVDQAIQIIGDPYARDPGHFDFGTLSGTRVVGNPLFVAVGLSAADVTADSREAAWEAATPAMLIALLVIVVSALVYWHRRALARFQVVLTLTLENMGQGILMVDQHGRVQVINRRVGTLLGLPSVLARKGVLFRSLVRWQQNHDEFGADSETRQAVLDLVSRGGLLDCPPIYERTRPNGVVIEVRSTVLPDGSVVRTYTDVTERKQIERDLAAARDAAEAASRARADFLAVMSHEIRTPINGVIGMSTILLEGTLPEEARHCAEVIRDSGSHLLLLVDDILSFSGLEAGRVELENLAFDFPAVIRGTIDMLAGAARGKGLALECVIGPDVPRVVAGDAGRLRQILINLAGNAIKFTEHGQVTVEASVEPQSNGSAMLAIAVADTGIGISAEMFGKLFRHFSQVDSSISRRFGGSGLGLAICRKLVELMGGTISVNSMPGRGSTFRFVIPLRPVELAPTAVPDAAPPLNLRVLVVEDNPTNRLVVTRMGARMGCVVDAVTDGDDAIEAVQAKPYDLVLMDLMMPGTDGLTATRIIRRLPPPVGAVPIIGVTANAHPEDRRACMTAGMNGFVTKPLIAERLRAEIKGTSGDGGAASMADGTTMELLDSRFLGQLAEDIGPDGVAEALQLFQEDAPGRIGAIRRCQAAGQPLDLRREVHALAGAARNVGMTLLGQSAYALQQSIEANRLRNADIDEVVSLAEASLQAAAKFERELLVLIAAEP